MSNASAEHGAQDCVPTQKTLPPGAHGFQLLRMLFLRFILRSNIMDSSTEAPPSGTVQCWTSFRLESFTHACMAFLTVFPTSIISQLRHAVWWLAFTIHHRYDTSSCIAHLQGWCVISWGIDWICATIHIDQMLCQKWARTIQKRYRVFVLSPQKSHRRLGLAVDWLCYSKNNQPSSNAMGLGLSRCATHCCQPVAIRACDGRHRTHTHTHTHGRHGDER